MEHPSEPLVRLRLADPHRDAGAVAAIYEPHVTSGLASFETEAPDATEMATRIARTLRWAPWLVAVETPAADDDRVTSADDRVIGYAYGSRHAERAGYRWAVDLSAYIAPDRQGRGVGRRLYEALLPVLRSQGFLNAYAGIALPNPGSVRLHTSIGMRPFATYRRVGWKHGRWLDVAWFHMTLVTELPDPPPEPVALPDLSADPAAVAFPGVIPGS